MELHYCFTPHFCNPRSGWEKGKVERSVEHIRRRAFDYDVRFGLLEQAQCHLDKVCDRLNGEASNMSAQEKKERVQADIAALRSAMPVPGSIPPLPSMVCITLCLTGLSVGRYP